MYSLMSGDLGIARQARNLSKSTNYAGPFSYYEADKFAPGQLINFFVLHLAPSHIVVPPSGEFTWMSVNENARRGACVGIREHLYIPL